MSGSTSKAAEAGGAGAAGRLRGFAAYGVSRVLVETLLGLRGLVLAAILGPEVFGIWALFRIALTYCGSADLGVLRGLEVEASAPRPAAAMDAEASRAESAGTTVGFTLVVFGALSLLAAAAAALLADGWLAPALAGVAGALVFERLWAYGLTYLRATSDLWRLAVYELANAGLQVALVVALALVWGLNGALFGFVLVTAAALLLLHRRVPMRPSLRLSRLRSLLRTGFPVGLSFFLLTSQATVDRVVVAGFGGAEPLGYYAFAVALSSLGAALAFALRTLVFPALYRDARAKGAEAATGSHLRGTILPFAWTFSPLLGVLALALDPAVRSFAPDYASAIPAARIFLFIGVVAGLANLATLGIVAANRQWLLPLLTGGALVLNLTLALAALTGGLGLEGLAAAMLLGRTVYAGAILIATARSSGLADWPALLGRTLLPLLWCAAVVAVLGRLAPITDASAALVALVAYTLALLPLVPFGWVVLREFRQPAPCEAGGN